MLGAEGDAGGAGLEDELRGGAAHDGGDRPERRRLHRHQGIRRLPLHRRRQRRRLEGAPRRLRPLRPRQERPHLRRGAPRRPQAPRREVLPRRLPPHDKKRRCRRRRQRQLRGVQEDDGSLLKTRSNLKPNRNGAF